MRRREFIELFGGALMAWPLPAQAQQAERMRRIGLMGNLPLKPIQTFRDQLRKLGYAENRNLAIEFRFAEGHDDRYPEFAADLVASNVELIVTWGTPATFAAKKATTTIPVVLVAGDVMNTGIVSNLARPEANLTGFVALNVELEEKRLELLKEVVPGLRRVAILSNSLNPLNRFNLETARRAAEKLSIEIDNFEVLSSQEVEAALRRLVEKRPDAVLVASDTLLMSERQQIVDTMKRQRIPAIYPFREYADVGGLFAYGANISALFEHVAEYVDRLLKGEKPSDLPVQQATSFELIINLKAAAELGLTVPAIVLVRAEEVIE
jgi:putative ABC transport system substrate-binding protein